MNILKNKTCNYQTRSTKLNDALPLPYKDHLKLVSLKIISKCFCMKL